MNGCIQECICATHLQQTRKGGTGNMTHTYIQITYAHADPADAAETNAGKTLDMHALNLGKRSFK
jgi:hypothetical protein